MGMRKFVIALTCMFLLLSSCIPEKNVTRKYYTLELPETYISTMQPAPERLQGECEIGRVSVNPVYDRNQIVNRNDSHEISYYVYHQWAVRPDEAIRELLYNYLDTKNIFERVASRYSRSIPDYRMEASIEKLEIVDNNSFSAHIQMEFTLYDNSNDSILVVHGADRKEPLQKRNLNLFALEVSNIFCEELEVFTDLIGDIM